MREGSYCYRFVNPYIKRCAPWRGPYKIIKRVSPVHYIMKMTPTNRNDVIRVNIVNIKPYRSSRIPAKWKDYVYRPELLEERGVTTEDRGNNNASVSSSSSSDDSSSGNESTAGEPEDEFNRPAGEATDTTSCYGENMDLDESSSNESSSGGNDLLHGPNRKLTRRKLRPRGKLRPPARLDW